jgi:hypothetical protein
MPRTATTTPLWVHSIRAILGVIFFSAGISKLVHGFPSIIGPVWLIDRLEPYGLGLFGQFIAVSEAGVGLLLISRRLATLGAIMLVPMLSSILVVTISLEWRGTPIVNSFLLLLNAALLAHDYPKWRGIFGYPVERDRESATPARLPGLDLAWWGALAVILASPILVRGGFGLLYLLAVSIVVALGLYMVEHIHGRGSDDSTPVQGAKSQASLHSSDLQ